MKDKVACSDAIIKSLRKKVITWARGHWDNLLPRVQNSQEVALFKDIFFGYQTVPCNSCVEALSIILRFELRYKCIIWEINVWFSFGWRFRITVGLLWDRLTHKKEALVTFFQENPGRQDTLAICTMALAPAETNQGKSFF